MIGLFLPMLVMSELGYAVGDVWVMGSAGELAVQFETMLAV